MTNSYVGIISPCGLETLVPETEHAASFLLRRLAHSRPNKAIVFWAVVDEQAAGDIADHVRCGQFDEAFRQLNARALDLGTLLPPTQEEDELFLIG